MIKENKVNEVFDYSEKVKNLNAGKTLRVHIITFGCQQNESDSEKLYGLAEKMGYTKIEDPAKADLIIFNTCAVRAHAEDKALSMLGNFKARKKINDKILIGVVGCMAAEASSVDRIKNDFHYVDFTLEPSYLHRLPEAVYTALTESRRSFLFGCEEFDFIDTLPSIRKEAHRGLVSIMYGCNNFCSYCIVPYTRGRERSRCSYAILEECRALVSSGVKEIMLLGQNVNSYRSDINFPELLSRVAAIEGDFIIRFMTSHPKDATDELIEVMSKYSPKIAPFFHLPLQSGSNRILSAMNRRYTRENYLEFITKIKNKIPSVALSTDIIVGFPDETEEDFLDTLNVLSAVEFDLVYAFIYSRRNGTKAATFKDDVPREVKVERLTTLLKMQDDICIKRNIEYIGKTVRVLIDSEEMRGGVRVVTGKTNTNKPVHVESPTAVIGQFINVEIIKACATHLLGAERGNTND